MRDVHIDINEVLLDRVEVSDPDAFRAELIAALTELAAAYTGDYFSGRATVLSGAQVPEANAARVAQSVWHSIVPGGGL